MTCEVVKMTKAHLKDLLKQPINFGLHPTFTDEVMNNLELSKAVSIDIDGEIQLCAGIADYWQGRGHIWTIFSETSKHHFVVVFRTIKKWLQGQLESNYQRIEVSIPCDLKIGIRRAKLLGFALECERAKKFLPDGTDCSIYVMVRE